MALDRLPSMVSCDTLSVFSAFSVAVMMAFEGSKWSLAPLRDWMRENSLASARSLPSKSVLIMRAFMDAFMFDRLIVQPDVSGE